MREFTCARCGGRFESNWTDEEARLEAGVLLTEDELSGPLGVVCEGCFRKIERELPRLRAELDQDAARAGMTVGEFIRSEAAALDSDHPQCESYCSHGAKCELPAGHPLRHDNRNCR